MLSFPFYIAKTKNNNKYFIITIIKKYIYYYLRRTIKENVNNNLGNFVNNSHSGQN